MIITLLRKPLEGTVAENTLKHGCGAINIDETRVSFGDESINFEARQRQQADPREKGWSGHVAQVGSDIQMYKEKGRWPANFILIHKEGCELKGTKKIKEGVDKSDKGGTEREVGLYKDGLKKRAKDHHQGEETVANWVCVLDCPVKELDQQSGHLKSTTRNPTGNPIYPTSNTSVTWNANNVMDTTQRGFNDEGGASRYFKQFKDDERL